MKKHGGRIKTKWVMENYPQWVQKYNEVVYRTKCLAMEKDALVRAIEELESCRPIMKMVYENQ